MKWSRPASGSNPPWFVEKGMSDTGAYNFLSSASPWRTLSNYWRTGASSWLTDYTSKITVSWPWSFAQQMILLLPNSSQYQSAPSSLREQRKISGNRNLQNVMLRWMPQSQTQNLDAETLAPIDQRVVESSTMFWSCLSLWLKYS